jgi:iron(III) transport system substrate-binding protein
MLPSTRRFVRDLRVKGAVSGAVLVMVVVFSVVVYAADSDGVDGSPPAGHVTLYTSVTQDTVDAVLDALAEQQPGLDVAVFRAPTGALDARIATELRSGGLQADVLWMTDPLSVQRYAADGLLAPLRDGAVDAVPVAYRSDEFVGTRLLNLVIVAGRDLEVVPTSWESLTDETLAGAVALPDPGFAGSAFAALGYFATSEDLGMEFLQRLKDNEAVQVSSPGEVLNGVAEGRFSAGITLDKIARSAIEKGSPVDLIWPDPGAIVLYSPAAVVDSTDDPAAAHGFVEFLVSPEAQTAIASTGWQPVRPDVAWPYDGAAEAPDWDELFGRQQALLEGYRAIFGD